MDLWDATFLTSHFDEAIRQHTNKRQRDILTIDLSTEPDDEPQQASKNYKTDVASQNLHISDAKLPSTNNWLSIKSGKRYSRL